MHINYKLCMLIMNHLWDGLILTNYEPWFYLLHCFDKPIEPMFNCSVVLYIYKYIDL